MLETLLVLGLVYVAYNSGALRPFGIAPGVSAAPYGGAGGAQPNVSMSATPIVSAPPMIAQQSFQPAPISTTSKAEIAGVGAAGAILSSSAVLLHLGIAAQAVPVVGQIVGAVAAIAAAFLAAHAMRVKQATDENSAMNLGVSGVDHEMQAINQAYNARQIDAQGAIQLLQGVMAHYWALVNPHIQPGRNGCSGGSACPPWPASGSGCTGSIGAACCVGCYDLAGGPQPAVLGAFDGGDGSTPFYFGVMGAIIVVQHGGGQSCMQGVVASQYGGKNRNGYRLNWQQVGA